MSSFLYSAWKSNTIPSVLCIPSSYEGAVKETSNTIPQYILIVFLCHSPSGTVIGCLMVPHTLPHLDMKGKEALHQAMRPPWRWCNWMNLVFSREPAEVEDMCKSCLTHALAKVVQRWYSYELSLKQVFSINAKISSACHRASGWSQGI